MWLWRCELHDRVEVGRGRGRHVQYKAQLVLSDDEQTRRSIQFRFSELATLRMGLTRMPELRDIVLLPLPPKVTMRSLMQGQFAVAFQEDRQERVQRFVSELFIALAQKYNGVGDPLELCEPLAHSVNRWSERAAGAEAAAIAEVVRAAEVAEDRELIAKQNEEYEESLRRDKDAAEKERSAAEAAAEAYVAEMEREKQERCNEAVKAEDRANRRQAFEAAHPPPARGEPQAAIRFRTARGESNTRTFAAGTCVEILFEYVSIAEWKTELTDGFDLRTTHPVRSLQAERGKTLEQAGLCPSVALVIAEADD